MEKLIHDLKRHFDLKLEEREYASVNGITDTVKSVFNNLETAFAGYSIGGEPLVWSTDYLDDSNLSLYVRTLKEGGVIREFHCSQTSSTSRGFFTLECVLPDSSLGGDKKKIGSIEVLDGYSVLKEFGNGSNLVQSFGLDGGESRFTRTKFEEFLERVLMYEI